MRAAHAGHSTMRLADVAHEAASSLAARPARTALLCLGASLGTAALAASLTLAASAAARVSVQFDELRSTRVTVTNPTDQHWLRPADLARLRSLPGVTAAGPEQAGQEPAPMAQLGAGRSAGVPASITAATPAALQAEGAVVLSGRAYDGAATARGDAVVLLGVALARSLHIGHADGRTQITVDGTRALVVGIVTAAAKGNPNLLLGAYVPSVRSLPAAAIRWQAPTVVIDTALRATDAIATAAPLALAPQDARSLIVQTPPDPQGLRSAVGGQLQVLLLVLGGVSLAIGAVVIGTAALSAIAQRRTDIALRRALGATRTAIYLQVLIETAVTGALGGLVGVYVGEFVTAVVSGANHWPIVTSLVLVPAGVVLGVLAGTLAGLYPAAAAAGAQPADALRA